MNKTGFMTQLEGLLADIPAAEKEEALQYYNDYFEDAGSENEQDVINSLGSPKDIADNIKAELKGEVIPDTVKAGDHAITKYGQIVESKNQTDSGKQEGAGAQRNGYGGQGGQSGANGMAGAPGKQGGFPAWLSILLVVLFILFCPGVLAILAFIVGALIGFISTWFSLIVTAGTTALSLLGTAVGMTVLAFMSLPSGAVVFITILGLAMICGSLGLLALMLTVWMCVKATPAIARGIFYVCRMAFGGLKKLWKNIFG